MHFYCEGHCEGVAPKPGTCQATLCDRYEQPLTRCDCEDPAHTKVEKKEDTDTE